MLSTNQKLLASRRTPQDLIGEFIVDFNHASTDQNAASVNTLAQRFDPSSFFEEIRASLNLKKGHWHAAPCYIPWFHAAGHLCFLRTLAGSLQRMLVAMQASFSLRH